MKFLLFINPVAGLWHALSVMKGKWVDPGSDLIGHPARF